MGSFDVLYTINANYLDIMLASIYSLILNGGQKNLRLHIIGDKLSLNDYKTIEEKLNKFNVEYYFYDLQNFDISKYNIPDFRNCQIANARLFYASILKNNLCDIKNLLYLDADTLVVGNLELENFQNNTINAVYELGPKAYYNRLNLNGRYFNSGVLYFNVLNWLNNDCEKMLADRIAKGFSNLQFPDQDILNITLKDYITSLPLAYNLSSTESFLNSLVASLYFNSPFISGNSKDVEEAKSNPKIIHAYGLADIKPWTNSNLNPYHDVWMKYLKMVNEGFVPTDLEKFQEFFNEHRLLLTWALVLKNFSPVYLQDVSRTLVKKINKDR